MSDASYKIVLSDKLYSIYKRASTSNTLTVKEKKSYDLLIGNIELEILTNVAQIQRCKDHHDLPEAVYEDLLPAEDQKNLTLQELAKLTLFKLILTLTDGEVKPPYFNLKTQNVRRNYNITCLHDEDKNNADFFKFLPGKNIEILYVENRHNTNGIFIHDICKKNVKWNVKKCDTTKEEFNRFAKSHDRYLIINNQVEITLSSVFSYLWDNKKEITCIIKEL